MFLYSFLDCRERTYTSFTSLFPNFWFRVYPWDRLSWDLEGGGEEVGLSWRLGNKESAVMQKMEETQFWSLGWEDPLEKQMTIHSSILTWQIPRTEEHGELQSMGSQRVGQDLMTKQLQQENIVFSRNACQEPGECIAGDHSPRYVGEVHPLCCHWLLALVAVTSLTFAPSALPTVCEPQIFASTYFLVGIIREASVFFLQSWYMCGLIYLYGQVNISFSLPAEKIVLF